MSEEELIKALKEMDKKRVEELEPNSRKLFDAIMKIANSRDRLLEEKQELIDYLKEEINETKESWGNCVYYNNEKGMFEAQIEIRLLEKILSKIEKR